MKNLILSIVLFFMFFNKGYSQDITSSKVKYAFERRVYERWDKFRPWWWFKVLYRKYDDEDRRNVLNLTPIMVTTGITKDYTESQKKSIDTIFNAKIADAADRLINKRWILFDEAKYTEVLLRIGLKLEQAAELGLSFNEQFVLSERMLSYMSTIDILLNSFIGDAEKSLQINKYIKEMEEFEKFLDSILVIQRKSNSLQNIDNERPN